VACLREHFWRGPKNVRNFLVSFLLPATGAVICLVIWTSLPLKTLLLGGAWMAAGIGYLAVRTSGFRKPVPMMDFSDKE
jgi:putrescine importer